MEKINKIKIIIRGIIFSYLTTFILILLYSAILAYTKVPESTIPTCLFVIGMSSVFMSSSITVIKLKNGGLKNGGIIGLCYVLILYLCSSISENTFALTKYSIVTIIFYILVGMIGGIIGVNLVKQR